MSNFACPKCGKVWVDSPGGVYAQKCDCDNLDEPKREVTMVWGVTAALIKKIEKLGFKEFKVNKTLQEVYGWDRAWQLVISDDVHINITWTGLPPGYDYKRFPQIESYADFGDYVVTTNCYGVRDEKTFIRLLKNGIAAAHETAEYIKALEKGE